MGVLQLSEVRPTVTVFGSALARPGEDAYELARELGRRLAEANFRLCNGGYGGTMEASARGAREALGSAGGTIGVTCALFSGRSPNPWIDEVRHTGTLFERLEQLITIGDAYVVLPGGTGTLLELAAILELTAKHLLGPRPIVLLGEYWRPVLDRIGGAGHPGGEAYAQAVPVGDIEECIIHLVTNLGGTAGEP